MIRGAALAALGGVTIGVALLLLDRSSDSPPVTRPSLVAAVPADDPLAPAPAPGLSIPAPRLLANGEAVSVWAPLRASAVVRAAPSSNASALGTLPARTPEGTTNIALVTGNGVDRQALWVPVRAAGLTGWISRAALGGYQTVDTLLEVDTRAFTATLHRAGRVVFSAPVGVGTVDAPTPTGDFFVRNVLTRYSSAAYGPIAFGTSARSETLTDWPAGGFVGIHGTDRPDLLPGRVSHGCIRLRNIDILALARLMPVGTPVTIT